MDSLRLLFQIGMGPSSSHTMGPHRAATKFLKKMTDGLAVAANDDPSAAAPVAPSLVERFQVTLYGSLGATGKGHLTDQAIAQALKPYPVEFIWKPEVTLPRHPNAMDFEGLDGRGVSLGRWRVYSVGGGALAEDGDRERVSQSVYPLTTMTQILQWSQETGEPLWRYVEEREGADIWAYLDQVWTAMSEAIERGVRTEGVLPGGLRLTRKSRSFLLKAERSRDSFQRTGKVAAYALAVAEENAVGHQVVTAPTCGSCGIVPGVLHYVQQSSGCHRTEILRALATAGLVGNLIKTNASISGAEVGCQGEVGSACAMAAAAAAQLFGATVRQIEYAAEMGLEHHLGLTCDPVGGLVQIPCIERNAFASTRALDCADYALLSDGVHQISFDEVVATMKQTGIDLASAYRETSAGGLAVMHR